MMTFHIEVTFTLYVPHCDGTPRIHYVPYCGDVTLYGDVPLTLW